MVLCAKCKTIFDSQEPKCPNCGSMDRDIEVFDSFDMMLGSKEFVKTL